MIGSEVCCLLLLGDKARPMVVVRRVCSRGAWAVGGLILSTYETLQGTSEAPGDTRVLSDLPKMRDRRGVKMCVTVSVIVGGGGVGRRPVGVFLGF